MNITVKQTRKALNERLLFSAYSMDGLEADMDSLVYKPEHCILETSCKRKPFTNVFTLNIKQVNTTCSEMNSEL